MSWAFSSEWTERRALPAQARSVSARACWTVGGAGVGTSPLSARLPEHRLRDPGDTGCHGRVPQGLEQHKRPLLWARGLEVAAGFECDLCRRGLCARGQTDRQRADRQSSGVCSLLGRAPAAGPHATSVTCLEAPSPDAVVSPQRAGVSVSPAPSTGLARLPHVSAKPRVSLPDRCTRTDRRTGCSFSLVCGGMRASGGNKTLRPSARGRQVLSRDRAGDGACCCQRVVGAGHGGSARGWDGTGRGRTGRDEQPPPCVLPPAPCACLAGDTGAETGARVSVLSPGAGLHVPRRHRLVSRRSASGVLPCLLPSSTRVPGEDSPAGANLLPADDVDGVLGSRQRWACLLTPARGGTMMTMGSKGCLFYCSLFTDFLI